MGQQIEVSSQAVGDIALFDTDRSVTGQDGAEFASADEAVEVGGFPGDLAARLFESDDSIATVFIASNGVSIARTGGWDETSLQQAGDAIAAFFIYYGEDTDS